MNDYDNVGQKDTAHTTRTVDRAGGRETVDGDATVQSRDQIGRGEPTYTDGPKPDNGLSRALTDGGRREVDPHIEPEFVGAHSDRGADTCQLWTGEEPSPCDNTATHTLVHYDGKLKEVAACDDCGEPGDVQDWGRQWSTKRGGEE